MPVTLQCPHGATGPDPGADCPVAHPRDARGGALTGELDWREGGVDALVGADEGLEVGGMGDVPERLLEHERDARRLPHAAAWSKRASKSAGSPQLIGHASVVVEVVDRAERPLGHRLDAQPPGAPRHCGEHRRRGLGEARARQAGSSQPANQGVAIAELARDRVEQPRPPLVPGEDHVVAPVVGCHSPPRVEGAVGVVQHHGVVVEGEAQPAIGEAVCELDVLGPAKRRVEPA